MDSRIRLALVWARRAGLAVAGLAAIGLALSTAWVSLYRYVDPPGTALMAWRSFQGHEVRYQPRRLYAIAPDLMISVIGAEDSRFCAHDGFDLEAIRQALDEAQRGKGLRGASTLSQQTAKNAFLWHGRGWVRKGAEARFTFLIETLWPKERILEVYLNIAEWGDGAFGAEAAAQLRFNKSAEGLSAREAALLAAVLPNPNSWRLDPPGPYVSGRAVSLQARAVQVRAQGLAACVIQ